MTIIDRLRNLEGRGGAGCPECRLRPASTHVVYPGEEGRALPEPEHCPKCGRLIDSVVIRVVYEDE
jgi:hypothetical protein